MARPRRLPILWLTALAAACGDSADPGAPNPATSAASAGQRGSTPAGRRGSAGDDALAVVPGESRPVLRPALADKYRRLDAGADDWDAEVMSDLASRQLDRLSAFLAEPSAALEELEGVASQRFRCAALRPAELTPLFESDVLRVHGGTPASEPGFSGPDGLARALAALREPFAPEPLHVKFKVVHVDEGPSGTGTTELVYAAHGPARADRESGSAGELQQHATWRCAWTRADEAESVVLDGIEVVEHEESLAPGGLLYADCTRAVLGANACFETQLLPHLETWLGSIPARVFGEFLGHQGLAVADVDGDGLDDVYLCQPGGLPDRLFLQSPDGTARDVSAEAGVDFLDPSRAVLFVDLDGDRDQDMVLATAGGILVLSSDGARPPRFTPRWSMVVHQIHSLSAADYDEDGDLDVYCCVYKIPEEQNTTPAPYHDANNGEPNVFLRNDLDGDTWTFTDVTRETGLDANNRRFSFACSWEDYDNDGDLDLYVANDFGRNNLYRNDDGHFVDVAAQAGVEDVSAGMAATWADYDNDGLVDLYVSNMFSSAGNRIAYQRRFHEGAGEETRSLFRRHARGNSLFKNVGDGTFVDVSVPAGVTMGRWAWGSKFVDLNNDGLQDLVVPNGMVTSDEPKDL